MKGRFLVAALIAIVVVLLVTGFADDSSGGGGAFSYGTCPTGQANTAITTTTLNCGTFLTADTGFNYGACPSGPQQYATAITTTTLNCGQPAYTALTGFPSGCTAGEYATSITTTLACTGDQRDFRNNLALYWPVTLGGSSIITTPDLSTFSNTGTFLGGAGTIVQFAQTAHSSGSTAWGTTFSSSFTSGDLMLVIFSIGDAGSSFTITGPTITSGFSGTLTDYYHTSVSSDYSIAQAWLGSFTCSASCGTQGVTMTSSASVIGVVTIFELASFTLGGLTGSTGSGTSSNCCAVTSYTTQGLTVSSAITQTSTTGTWTYTSGYATTYTPSTATNGYAVEDCLTCTGASTLAMTFSKTSTTFVQVAISILASPATAYRGSSQCETEIVSGQCVVLTGATASNTTGIESSASVYFPAYNTFTPGSVQSAFTVSGLFWFGNLTTSGHYTTVLSWGGTASNSGFNLLLDSSGHLQVATSSVGTVTSETAITLSTSTWYWLGAYYSGTGTTVGLFAMSESSGTITTQETTVTVSSAIQITSNTIFYVCNYTTSGYSGCIDNTYLQEIRLYGFEFTTTQLLLQMEWYVNSYVNGN